MHARTHTLMSNILISVPPVTYSLPDHSLQVLVLQMTCQTHSGSKLAASLSAVTYLSSRFSTVSSPSLVLSQCGRSKVPTVQLHHPAEYIYFISTWHTAVSATVQSKLPTHQSANITVHCPQNEKIVNIQLCQYQYPWLAPNELDWTWKEVVTACLKYHCNICLKGQRKANENLSG